MTPEDVEAAYAATRAAFPEDRERLEQAPLRTFEETERYKMRYRHLLGTDPDGAFVSVDEGGRVAGVALSLRREGLWFLSLMAVDPAHRGKGAGRALLERALVHSAGCRDGMIPASGHPAAIRRYALAGFDLRPSLRAGGTVRRSALPKGLKVRDGAAADLELASSVDRVVRGAAPGPDVGALLRAGGRLLVTERPTRGRSGRRGYAVSLAPFGPLCIRGEFGPLAPYLPSMLYL